MKLSTEVLGMGEVDWLAVQLQTPPEKQGLVQLWVPAYIILCAVCIGLIIGFLLH